MIRHDHHSLAMAYENGRAGRQWPTAFAVAVTLAWIFFLLWLLTAPATN